jgi:hypothetical protein
MNELLRWLKHQGGSIHTLTQFQEQSLALRFVEPQHAAQLRLLADLASRFVEAYDGTPLPADVADRAFVRLTALVEDAVRASSTTPSEQLSLLNRIGLVEML